MNNKSIGNVSDGELFLAKMRKATTPGAGAALLLDDPTTEPAVLRGAAQYLVFVTNLNHRAGGHAASASEDCEVEKCLAGHEAASVFIAEAERRERKA
jgi:hypothetical protein